MTEIEAKARQLARVKGAPFGSYYVCREAIALEMADWMKEKTIEETVKWLSENFIDNSHDSGRGRYCEIITHDFDSMEIMIEAYKNHINKKI